MYMYVCLHPVLYNSNHKTCRNLLEAKDKIKQFTYSVHVRNLLSNTMHKEVWIITCVQVSGPELPTYMYPASTKPTFCPLVKIKC